MRPGPALLASAEHAFSHWVVVEGRVVDARGMPVPEARPTVTLEGARAFGPCLEPQQPATGPTGDYSTCHHVHEFPEGARATVALGGVNVTVPLDPVTRRAVAELRLPENASARDLAGERRFLRTLHVEGRVFARFDAWQDVDGVRVNATPRANRTVEIRLLDADGTTLARAEAPVDASGDYAADLDAEALPPGARVVVRAGEDSAEADADPVFRRVDVDVVLDLRRQPSPLDEERPGSRPGKVPLPGAGWAAALVLLTALARRGLGR